MASLTTYSGFDTLAKFRKAIAKDADTADQLLNTIKKLAMDLTSFHLVYNLRQSPETEQDWIYENHLLFLQHVMMLWNLMCAMREGDSGWVHVSLNYLMVWFQATSQFNYMMECLHLMACLTKLWSPDLANYWMENCLINPSAKKEGWMACDFLGEYVVQEVKSMMPFNINETTGHTLQKTYSPQIMIFQDTRKKMHQELEAPTFGYHSSLVKTHGDVEWIMDRLTEGQFCKKWVNRPTGDDAERHDLHITGLEELGTTVWIVKYIKKLEFQQGFLENDWEEDTEEVQIEITDSVFLVDDDGEQWL